MSGLRNEGSRRRFLTTLAGGALGAAAALPSPARAAASAQGMASCLPCCIKDYGAVGDGKTDDTQAIQRAIDAAHAVNGMEVFLPSGNYVVSALTLPNNVTLNGSGQDVTLITSAHPTGDVVTMTGFLAHIRNLAFGNAGGTPRTGGAYLRITHPAVQCSLENFSIHQAYIGVHVSAAETSDIRFGSLHEMSTTPGSCAVLYDDGDDHYLHRVTALGYEGPAQKTVETMPSYGIWCKGGVGAVQITDCDIIRMGFCLYVQGGDSIYAVNTFFDSSTCGIVFAPEQDASRGHFLGCWTSSHLSTGVEIQAPAHPSPSFGVGDQDFIGHHCFLNQGDGFRIDTGTNIQIANSSIAQNDGAGIVLGPGASGCRITNNMIGSTGRLNGNAHGIVIDPQSSRNLITDNRILGNTKAQIAGKGTRCAIHANMGIDI